MTPNEQRKATREATREKRKSQTCRVFQVKVDAASLSELQAESLKMCFVEAKWIYNEMIAFGQTNPIWDYRAGKTVTHRDRDLNEVVSELKYLCGATKQKLIQGQLSAIKGLATHKAKGRKVGRLKFKKKVHSLDLSTYGGWQLVGKKKIQLPKIGQVRVNGLEQIFGRKGKVRYELANCKLLKKPDGYFISITCYEKKQQRSKVGEVGIDLGVSTAVTTSDGRKFNATVQETDRLKRLQRALARQVKGSKRRGKTLHQLQKEYAHMTNKKNDLANKICAEIMDGNPDLYMQDDCIRAWKRRYGKKIHHSVLGRVKAKLKPQATYVLGRYVATTKTCTACGVVHKDMTLADRTFVCECGVTEDRDVHAAQNMIVMSKREMRRKATSPERAGVEAQGSPAGSHNPSEMSCRSEKVEVMPRSDGGLCLPEDATSKA